MMKRLQKGLSLVELMISLTVGSIITVGIVQLFGANSDTYNVMQGQSRMQESARFALDFIRRDLQKAGYRGCYSNNEDFFWTIADPANFPYEFDLRFGIQGYDGIGVNIWNPVLDPIPDANEGFVANTGIPKANVVTGTDLITVRNMAQPLEDIRLGARMSSSRNPIVVDGDRVDVGDLGFTQGDLAVIHDCEKATIFHVTLIDTATNAPDITLEHSTAPTVAWRNSFETLARKNTFETDAMVNAIESHTYYIAPGNGENSSGDTPLSLWRKSGTTPPIELVEGVEDLQVLYGVTDNDDLTPNRYYRANEVPDWKDVTTVRVTVVANTVDDVGGNSTPTHTCDVQTCYAGQPTGGIDGLLRRSFTQTFMLRNKS